VTGPATGPATGRTIHALLPAGVDDPARPSGGNVYDLRVCAGLAAAGRPVRTVTVPGAWPTPSAADRAGLAAALAGVPDGDVVLLDGLVGCPVPDVLAPHAGRLRLAVLVHLPLADETGLPAPLAAALDAAERRTLQLAAVVVATSTAVAGRLVERHGVAPARVHVAPPGVDQAPTTVPSDRGGRLLTVASVTPRKGHDVLLEALGTLADLPWEHVCAGPLDRDPQHVARVRARAEALGPGGRVRFDGALPGPAVAARYAAADLLVHPSLAEPYGMVVTEALARGVPVVASAVDGIPEALGTAPDGTLPGALVPPGDAAALAAALRGWLVDGDLRARWRAAALARRGTLGDWSTTVDRLLAALDTAGASGAADPVDPPAPGRLEAAR